MRARSHMKEVFTELDTFVDDPEMRTRADAIITRLILKYGPPFDFGRNRLVFANDHIVFKFPRNHAGMADNDWEGSCSAPYLARGKWLEIDGFICVMQERVQRLYADAICPKKLPDWVGSIDCCQVGYDRQGKLRAYDFGRN